MKWTKLNWLKRTLTLLMICLGMSFAPAMVHAQNPLTVTEYQQVIEQAIQSLDLALGRADPAQRATLAQQAADKLNAVRAVRLTSGQIITINNEELLKPLREPAPAAQNVRDVRARLQALRAALSGSPTQLTDAEREKLRDIFDQPPFKRENNWFFEWLDSWLSWLFRRSIGGVFDQRQLFTILGGVLVALIIVYFLRSLRFNSAAESALPIAIADAEAGLTSTQARDNAERLASVGDYRAAVRQLYLATLLLLDERGRLHYDRSLTNREYLRAVAATPALVQALKPVVDTFDGIWYGFAPINAQQFEVYRQQVERVREL